MGNNIGLRKKEINKKNIIIRSGCNIGSRLWKQSKNRK